MTKLGIWQALSGTVKVEIISAVYVETMNAVNAAGIHLSNIHVIDELSFSCFVERQQLKSLILLLHKRGDNVRILRRTGFYWPIVRLRKRPILVMGMLFLIAFSLYLPTRVLFVTVDGNSHVHATRILDEADKCGIRFGASRRSVRSEKIKNKLLFSIPELEWAGINTYGCVAVISVKERTAEQNINNDVGISSIVADRDGIIHSLTATAGNPLCHVGQAVTAGQVLISGYTDCGLSIKAERSKGEVMAYTTRDLTLITPNQATIKGLITNSETKYSIIFGKKLINLSQDSGILDTTCDKITKISYLTLPGGFELPLAFITECSIYRESSGVSRDEEPDWMRAYASNYVCQQMIAGKIFRTVQNYKLKDNVYILTAKFACLEMIGREQKEEIMKGNGKNG